MKSTNIYEKHWDENYNNFFGLYTAVKFDNTVWVLLSVFRFCFNICIYSCRTSMSIIAVLMSKFTLGGNQALVVFPSLKNKSLRTS